MKAAQEEGRFRNAKLCERAVATLCHSQAGVGRV